MRTPAEAVQFALSQSRWDHAMCLEFVWRCYSPDDSISSNLAAQGYPPPVNRAIDGWNGSPMKHTDRSPQIGAPVYYSAAGSGYTAGAGHVALYVGGGMIRSTDAGGFGINATVPLDWPERNWGRRMLGWTGDILGHPLTLAAPPTLITPRKRVRMFTFIRHPNGTITLINGETGTYRHLTPGEWAGYAAAGYKYAQVNASDFDATTKALRPAS